MDLNDVKDVLQVNGYDIASEERLGSDKRLIVAMSRR